MSSLSVLQDAPSADTGGTRADLRPQHIRDAVIRLAGNSQDGIQSAGAFLATARRTQRAGRDDLHDDPVHHLGRSVHLSRCASDRARCFPRATKRTCWWPSTSTATRTTLSFLKEGGVLLYDSDNVQPDPDDKRSFMIGVPITGLTVEALGGIGEGQGQEHLRPRVDLRGFSISISRSSKD